MKARDVMGSYVITVSPDVDVKTVATILVRNGISAVPVVNPEGKLLGIVSEGDLMRRAEAGTDRRSSWWLDMLSSPEQQARDYVRAHARKVADVMTREVITARSDTPLREIADLLEKHNIKRVPIVDNDQVIGIVSRANLVQALASRQAGIIGVEPTDEKLREAVIANLRSQPGSTALVNVIAEDGVVSLWGFVANEAEKNSVRVAAEVTPGVKAVNENLHVRKFAMAV